MKKLIVAVLLAAMMLSLWGCGMSDEEYPHVGDSLVIILGNHANANRYDEAFVQRTIRPLLEKAVSREIVGRDYMATLNVSVIVSDGAPVKERMILDGYEVELVSYAKSIDKSLRDIENMIEDVEDFLMLDSLRAVEPGVNLPAAIAEAERILRNNPGANNRILIYDTGVVTEGRMGMGLEEDGLLDIQKGSVDDVLNRLGENFFPKLEGIDVEFYGLGDVCIGQKDIRDMEDTDLINQFVSLWQTFFARCNVKSINTLTIAEKGDSPMLWDVETDPYPVVRNVPFYEVPVPEPDPTDPTEPTEPKEGPVVPLSASELGGFKGDKAEFRNESQARSALQSYYEKALKVVKENPQVKLYIVGSRAITSPEDPLVQDHETSASRAIAVSELIQEMFGIPAEQIVEIDAGVQRFTWSSKAEEFPGGKWREGSALEAAQAEHRVVTLIPATDNNQSRLDELAHEQDICP